MSGTKKVVRTQAFKVVMSKGDPIKIDEEELDGVIEGMNNGSVIIVKQGVINPSYLVGIQKDGERIEEFTRECQATFIEENGKTQGENNRARGMSALPSIFGETKVGMAIEAKHQLKLSKSKKPKALKPKS